MHTVYELERKPQEDVNSKPHVFGLAKDLLDTFWILRNGSNVDAKWSSTMWREKTKIQIN
jgi:hypothetical protein